MSISPLPGQPPYIQSVGNIQIAGQTPVPAGNLGEAEVDGEAVGGLEADAVDLAGELVGLGLDDLLRGGVPFFHDAPQ